ncbi:hypothetical protein CANARDRAFT_27050 [[Candida] arabinofermentans NRRL YB-2248]|uniref:Uncharacterized protein n=1 Tax=[Candida] arabinofermentans NRRL YB-2248 TaxID=983967 RepID=A0A1E4T4H3_9ASCO|nr:hypothetical protein CANARDRAFT_27050 [[Candida] arabinofermentans NRRL YB-2248]
MPTNTLRHPTGTDDHSNYSQNILADDSLTVIDLKLGLPGLPLETPMTSPANNNRMSSTPPSINSSVVSSIQPKRHFDQRLKSRISYSPSSLKTGSLLDKYHTRSSATSMNLGSNTESPEAVKWPTMKKLSSRIYSRDFRLQYGEVRCVCPGDSFIAFGTEKGYIVLFDYQQQLIDELGPKTTAVEKGPISSITISLDSTYVASGYKTGDIYIWDISIKAKPIIHIPPVSSKQDASIVSSFTKGINSEGHLSGTPIIKLNFVGKRHTAIYSVDQNGVMVSHNGGRTLMGYYIKSQIMLGKPPLPNQQIDYSNLILSHSTLPIGSSPQLTDTMGVMSIITPNALIVISTTPDLQTHFKIGRPKIANDSLGVSGCVAWFPATVNRAEKSSNPPILSYCWSNVLTLFEVFSDSIEDSHGNMSTMLRFENKRRWVCSECIVMLQWVNSKIIVVMTKSQRLIFINKETLKMMFTIDLISKHIKSYEIYPKTNLCLITEDYTNVFRTFRGKLFILGKYEFYVGSLSNWADKLFDLLKSGRYVDALEEARLQYEGTCDLTLVGLPSNDELRHQMVYGHITELLEASLNFLFTDSMVLNANFLDREDMLASFLNTAFKVGVSTKASPEIYESLFEKFQSNDLSALFFDSLEPFILREQISTLPPVVLKSMVEEYIKKGKGEILEELICLLDIKQLDLDLTISLCKANNLMDTLVYIWNLLMCDYITPLIDAIKILKKLTFFDSLSIDDDVQQLKESAYYVYPYISYILTGRQYPSDKPVDSKFLESSKRNIYYVLFNGAPISWPKGADKIHIVADDSYVDNEPAFPYLYLLLKYDSSQMFACLNECFEDELLNDDEILSFAKSTNIFELKVNRQYIIDVLLGVFDQNKGDLTAEDHTYLSIFIARNYPKYFQFIRLSESTLNQIIEHLCTYPTHDLKDDCELSLQSLLSVYKPASVESMIPLFEAAGFYNALLSIYNSENKTLQLLKLWIDARDDKKTAEIDTHLSDEHSNPFLEPSFTSNDFDYGTHGSYEVFESFASMVQKCFDKSKGHINERLQIENYIKENFERFIRDYPSEICEVFSINCPSLNSEILHIDDSNQKYEYLKSLFELEAQGKLQFEVPVSLKLEYIRILIKFDRSELKKYVLRMTDLTSDMIEILKKNGELEIVIAIHQKNNHYQQAIDETILMIDQLGASLAESETLNKDIENKMWSYLFSGFKILQTKELEHVLDNGLTENESLLLKLVECTVNLFVKANNELSKHEAGSEEHDKRSKLLSIFKRFIQDSFTSLINIRKNSSDSFLKIFNEFLNRSSVKVTTLGDVRSLVNEIFLAYSHEEKIFGIILQLVNEDIYRDLETLESFKLKGWSLMNLECEVCGKSVWGSGISSDNFDLWQENKLLPLKKLKSNEEGDSHDLNTALVNNLEIIVFQCKHGYHTRCLNNLGVIGSKKSCILCYPNEGNTRMSNT